MMHPLGDYFLASTAVLTGDVVCGPGANIWYGCVLRGDLATITLAPRVNLQDGCIVHTDADQPMTIEEGVVVGHAAMLHGQRIGRDTLIGIGARLLGGCEIGPDCLIAAGSLVPEGKRIPAGSVVMGIPGKIVRSITPAEQERTRWINQHYFELAQRYARGEIRIVSPGSLSKAGT